MKFTPNRMKRQRAVRIQLLRGLSLSAAVIVGGSVADVVVGQVPGLTAGSTPTLVGTAGGRFKLVASGSFWFLAAAAVATDYDVATSHTVTIRETFAGYTNSPRDTELVIAVVAGPHLWTPLDLGEKLEAWWCVLDLPYGGGAPDWALTTLVNAQTWVDRSPNAHVATLSVSAGSTSTRFTVCDGFTAAGVEGVGRTILTRNNAGGAVQNGGAKGGFTLPNGFMVGAVAPGAFTLLKSGMNATSLEIYICGGVFGNIGTSGNADLYHWQGGTGTGVESDMGGTVHVGFNHSSTLATPQILGVTSAPGERLMYMDGAVAYTSASNTVAVAASGKRLGWSQQGGQNFQFDGWFADPVFTNTALTTSERRKLEGWYAHTFDQLALLDVSHPYKIDPPLAYDAGAYPLGVRAAGLEAVYDARPGPNGAFVLQLPADAPADFTLVGQTYYANTPAAYDDLDASGYDTRYNDGAFTLNNFKAHNTDGGTYIVVAGHADDGGPADLVINDFLIDQENVANQYGPVYVAAGSTLTASRGSFRNGGHINLLARGDTDLTDIYFGEFGLRAIGGDHNENDKMNSVPGGSTHRRRRAMYDARGLPVSTTATGPVFVEADDGPITANFEDLIMMGALDAGLYSPMQASSRNGDAVIVNLDGGAMEPGSGPAGAGYIAVSVVDPGGSVTINCIAPVYDAATGADISAILEAQSLP